MSRSIKISGESLNYILYAITLAAFLSLLISVALPLGEGSLSLSILFTALIFAVVVAVWRHLTGQEGEYLGTDEDISYDPIADPGQAAKHRWEKAVRRLPGRDNDD